MTRSVPAAVELKTEYGDALNLVLVETARPIDQALDMIREKGWDRPGIAWTDESPFFSHVGRPSIVLLSRDGTVLVDGPALVVHDEVVRLVDEELAATGA